MVEKLQRFPRVLVATVIAAVIASAGCTYGPPVPQARVMNHVKRQGSDSLVLAVLAYEIREPTGLNSIIGGAPSLRGERAIFYLCVASQEQPSPVRRLAVVAKPRHMRTAFRSWVHSWGDPEIVIGSISGYDASTSDPAAARREWLRLHVSGRVERTAAWQGVQGASGSLPPSCEAAAIADALESVSAAVLPD